MAAWALLAGSAALAGCASIHDHRGYIIDQPMLQSIAPGIDNQASVTATMGRPTFVSQFGQPIWYYVSEDTRQPAFGLPRPIRETVIRVRFDAQNRVAAVDTADASHIVRIHPDGKVTPTLGRKRSFLEDLFGNIGTVGTGAGGAGGSGGDSGGNGGPNGS